MSERAASVTAHFAASSADVAARGDGPLPKHARGRRPPRPVRGRSWLPFLAGFLAIWGALAGIGEVDATGRLGLAILAVTLAVAVLVELIVHRSPPRGVLGSLGFGRPGGRALAAAAVVSALIIGVFPLFTLVTGETVELRPSWPWLLIGLLAFHGLAEELAWRGYAFRRLRAGRSFGRAVLWTMPLVAISHVPAIAMNGVLIGAGAVAVAAVTGWPLAYLYEVGGRTIWAPALVHTAIDSFKLVVFSCGTRDGDVLVPAHPREPEHAAAGPRSAARAGRSPARRVQRNG